MPKSIQLNVKNIAAMRRLEPAAFDFIRFDSNNNCNVRCVYCHNTRSDELVDLADFKSFLNQNVTSVDRFQFGCVMEPTLDPRLNEFFQIVAASPAKPKKTFRLQTNGILLHRHDQEKLIEAGLSLLTISVDSATSDTHKSLRGGTSLPKVQANLAAFHRAYPCVAIAMLTTVTTANIGDVDDLIEWGIEHGVRSFVLRQMFYYPGSPIVDHERMRSLMVSRDDFAAMRDRITHKFGNITPIDFLEDETLVKSARSISEASLIQLTV